jgi:DNA-binding NarL/FixJ family response regulator
MKVLLLDDHVLFRAGLGMLLLALQEDLEILESGACAEALEVARAHPDVRLCLLDLSLKDENGMSVVAAIKEASPGTAVVVVSGDENPATVYRALEEGAMGYIPKSVTAEVMAHALKLVLAGGIYLPASLLGPQNPGPSPGAATRLPADLTARQMEVLQCLLRGWPNKLISRHLSLSENTIKTHLSAIYRALGVATRSQAVIAASRLDIRSDFDALRQIEPCNG